MLGSKDSGRTGSNQPQEPRAPLNDLLPRSPGGLLAGLPEGTGVKRAGAMKRIVPGTGGVLAGLPEGTGVKRAGAMKRIVPGTRRRMLDKVRVPLGPGQPCGV